MVEGTGKEVGALAVARMMAMASKTLMSADLARELEKMARNDLMIVERRILTERGKLAGSSRYVYTIDLDASMLEVRSYQPYDNHAYYGPSFTPHYQRIVDEVATGDYEVWFRDGHAKLSFENEGDEVLARIALGV